MAQENVLYKNGQRYITDAQVFKYIRPIESVVKYDRPINTSVYYNRPINASVIFNTGFDWSAQNSSAPVNLWVNRIYTNWPASNLQ